MPLISVGIILTILYIQFVLLPSHLLKRPESVVRLSEAQLQILEEGLQKCRDVRSLPVEYTFPVSPARSNPRWNAISGQNTSVLLKNATLFDGKGFVSGPVDILFTKGVVTSVSPTALQTITPPKDAAVVDLQGKYVTPGLVDMHSHHLTIAWPDLEITVDDNEMHSETGPLTPFVRSLDGMKPYDTATAQIASGGVTSSLILPGSANIIGGEAYPVKNVVAPGENGEEVVEEMLLEHGIPKSERRRYLKMACGENPKEVYGHTRMGSAWKFRKHMARGQDLVKQQDAWCLSAAAARDTGDEAAIAMLSKGGGFPEDLELDSTVAMLRGKININIHCYETEDFEDMLLHSEEFGFHISAFHHALSAWKVPELIKSSGQNITIATFSDFGLYKKEAYDANVYAGKILAEHGIPVAYKSDHVNEGTSAKYLLFQAANAHSFGLPEDLALQSVTSVPATSLQLDHRIGYAREGYDADLVVWDSHPLSLGATPLQVYIDGKATLDPEKVEESLSKKVAVATEEVSKVRPTLDEHQREEACKRVQDAERIVITGISKSYLSSDDATTETNDKMTMVLQGGKVSCLGPSTQCIYTTSDTVINLQDGHVLPGLTAFTAGLGLVEIETAPETGDGTVDTTIDPRNPDNVIYAKYGIHLDGRGFDRARMGGITRAITAPLMESGFLRGVSVGFKTTSNVTGLDTGIFKEDVALHFAIGQISRGQKTASTISAAISKLRKILTDNNGKENIYGRAANGDIPLLIHVQNKYDILQMVKVKQDYPSVNLVLVGAPEAHAVAEKLAKAQIPVIVTSHRGHPDSFEKRNALSGPPLTKSLIRVLVEAGVKVALSNNGEGMIHTLYLYNGSKATRNISHTN